MSEGRLSRYMYSSGNDTGATVNTDPAASIGGTAPIKEGSVDVTEFRGSEIACESEWSATPTSRASGEIAQVFTNGNIAAVVGGWLLATEQNAADEPSFSTSNDARGSYAKILTMSAASNLSGAVDITLDRVLSGLADSGDNVRISMPGNLFANVTESEALAGIVDYAMLWFFKFETLVAGDSDSHDNILTWVDPVEANGCKIEVMRPEFLENPVGVSSAFQNALTSRFNSPFNAFGSALLINNRFNESGAAREFVTEALALQNGDVRTTGGPADLTGPIWLRRTIPAGTRGAECVFILRATSQTGHSQIAPTVDIAQSDYVKLNSGVILAFNIATPAPRVIDVSIDRRIHPGGGLRITATVVNGSGQPLPNRWFNITATAGTVTQSAATFTDENGKITVTYSLPLASPPTTVTISASIVDPA